jgi:acyl-CoA thioesterase-1
MYTLYTFGDSMLDCSRYNSERVSPGTLLCDNRDDLFAEFAGRDLASLGAVTLAHRAMDGAQLPHLRAQWPRKAPAERSCALLTIGGNDLLGGLLWCSMDEERAAFDAWFEDYEGALRECPVRPLFVGTVYDPTFALPEVERRFAPHVDARLLRARLQRFNECIRASAERAGAVCVDLHEIFQRGDPSWIVQEIEPSLVGASEIRRAFLCPVLDWARGC